MNSEDSECPPSPIGLTTGAPQLESQSFTKQDILLKPS